MSKKEDRIVSAEAELDKGIEKKYYALNIINTPNLTKNLAKWMVAIMSFSFLVMFLPWTQNFQAKGKLTTFYPEDRPQKLPSIIAGRIESWYVREGQFVNAGDTLVKISEIKDKFFDPNILNRKERQIVAKKGVYSSNVDKAGALQARIAALTENRGLSINKAKNKIYQAKLKVKSDSANLEAARTNYSIADIQFQRQKTLYEQGLKSRTEFEEKKLKFQEADAKLISAENKYVQSQNELINARLQLNSVKAEYNEKIAKAESELNSTQAYAFSTESDIAKLENEYSNLEVRRNYYVILAPQTGYVVKTLKAGIGETVKEGESVATIMPSDVQMAAEIYVKPMNIPLLEVGREVRLQFDGWPVIVFSGWPNVSFGTFGGRVAVIDNIDSNGKYRVLVVPDESEHKWPEQLRIGSGVNGWVMLKDVPIWYELWRQLNGFPPDYMDEAKGTKDVKTKAPLKSVK